MTRRGLSLLFALAAAGAGVGAGVSPAAADAGPRVASAVSRDVKRPRVAQATDAVTAAAGAITRAERARATLAEERATLDGRYRSQLAEIDRLKRQKASWRRDRALRARLAESVETAQALERLARELAAADAEVGRARARGVAAIDAALAATTGARKASLLARRKQWAPAPPARRIVIPDESLDPLADPEELEDQAAALADSEAELLAEVTRLDGQARRFDRQAALRRQHDRADELAVRDDVDPRPGVAGAERSGSFAADDEGSPAPLGPGEDASEPSFDRDVTVLSGVIDPGTVDVLRSAGRSTDPARRAVATRAARDAVARRLARLQQQRQAIEARARELRGGPRR